MKHSILQMITNLPTADIRWLVEMGRNHLEKIEGKENEKIEEQDYDAYVKAKLLQLLPYTNPKIAKK